MAFSLKLATSGRSYCWGRIRVSVGVSGSIQIEHRFLKKILFIFYEYLLNFNIFTKMVFSRKLVTSGKSYFSGRIRTLNESLVASRLRTNFWKEKIYLLFL